MSHGWNVVVLGATGAVGQAILTLLAKVPFPVGELSLLASEEHVGETRRFNGKSVSIQRADTFAWHSADLAFFAVSDEISARYAAQAAEDGCIVIDSSAHFALEPDIPLVLPTVNPSTLHAYRNRNIISVADALVSQLLVAVAPLMSITGLRQIQVVNLVCASAQGRAATHALAGESAQLLNGVQIDAPLWGKQMAFNLFPQLSARTDSAISDDCFVRQVRKIVRDDCFAIAANTLCVPVFYGNAQCVSVQGDMPLSVPHVQQVLAGEELIRLVDDATQLTPIDSVDAPDVVQINQLRNSAGIPELLQFWSVADNLHFAGALMAVRTATLLIREQLCH